MTMPTHDTQHLEDRAGRQAPDLVRIAGSGAPTEPDPLRCMLSAEDAAAIASAARAAIAAVGRSDAYADFDPATRNVWLAAGDGGYIGWVLAVKDGRFDPAARVKMRNHVLNWKMQHGMSTAQKDRLADRLNASAAASRAQRAGAAMDNMKTHAARVLENNVLPRWNDSKHAKHSAVVDGTKGTNTEK